MFASCPFRLVYYGESTRGLTTRLKEHKVDIRHHRVSSLLVNYVDDKAHLPKWRDAKALVSDLSKQHRKAYEFLYITSDKRNIIKKISNIIWAGVAMQVTAKSMRKQHSPGEAAQTNQQPL